MKEINNSGIFTVRHERTKLDVMFREDYARKTNSSKYKIKKMATENKLHELKVQGRKRLNSLVVVKYSNFKMFKTMLLSDEHGAFDLWDGRKWIRVMFADQYADKFGFASKQALEYHRGKSEKVIRVQRMNGDYINFFICK